MRRYSSIFAYLVIAGMVAWLVLFAYSIGLEVGQRHLITEGLKNGCIRFDFRTGGYEWAKP